MTVAYYLQITRDISENFFIAVLRNELRDNLEKSSDANRNVYDRFKRKYVNRVDKIYDIVLCEKSLHETIGSVRNAYNIIKNPLLLLSL